MNLFVSRKDLKEKLAAYALIKRTPRLSFSDNKELTTFLSTLLGSGGNEVLLNIQYNKFEIHFKFFAVVSGLDGVLSDKSLKVDVIDDEQSTQSKKNIFVIESNERFAVLAGLDQSFFLYAHLCFLVEIYGKYKRKEENFEILTEGVTEGILFEYLENEIWIAVNAFRALLTYKHICDHGVEQDLDNFSADFFQNVLALRPTESICLPCGSTGHAAYLTFFRIKSKNKIIARVDNLGEGSAYHNDLSSSKESFASTDSGNRLIKPKFIFELTVGVNTYNEQIIKYISAVCLAKLHNESEGLPALYNQDTGIELPIATLPNNFPGKPAQEAPNCAAINYHLGMEYRARSSRFSSPGVLFEWMKSQEIVWIVKQKPKRPKKLGAYEETEFSEPMAEHAALQSEAPVPTFTKTLPNQVYYYVPRIALENDINVKISNMESKIKKIVICGMTGSGKTEVAKRYFSKENIKAGWFFETSQTDENEMTELDFIRFLDAQYRYFAFRLDINIKSDAGLDPQFVRLETLRAIGNKLKSYPNWCLVFDNIMDKEWWNRYHGNCINDSWGRGIIMFTSQNSEFMRQNDGVTINLEKRIFEHNLFYELSDAERIQIFNNVLEEDYLNFGTRAELTALLDCDFVDFLPSRVAAIAQIIKNEKNLPSYTKLTAYARYHKVLITERRQKNTNIIIEGSELGRALDKKEVYVIKKTIELIMASSDDIKDILLFCFSVGGSLPYFLLQKFFSLKNGEDRMDFFINTISHYLNIIKGRSLLIRRIERDDNDDNQAKKTESVYQMRHITKAVLGAYYEVSEKQVLIYARAIFLSNKIYSDIPVFNLEKRFMFNISIGFIKWFSENPGNWSDNIKLVIARIIWQLGWYYYEDNDNHSAFQSGNGSLSMLETLPEDFSFDGLHLNEALISTDTLIGAASNRIYQEEKSQEMKKISSEHALRASSLARSYYKGVKLAGTYSNLAITLANCDDYDSALSKLDMADDIYKNENTQKSKRCIADNYSTRAYVFKRKVFPDEIDKSKKKRILSDEDIKNMDISITHCETAIKIYMETISNDFPVDVVFSQIMVDYFEILFKSKKYKECFREFLIHHENFVNVISLMDCNKAIFIITMCVLIMGVSERDRIIADFFRLPTKDKCADSYVNKLSSDLKRTFLLGLTPNGIGGLINCVEPQTAKDKEYKDFDNFASEYMTRHTDMSDSLKQTLLPTATDSEIKRITSAFFNLKRERSGSGLFTSGISTPRTSVPSEASTPQLLTPKGKIDPDVMFPLRISPPPKGSKGWCSGYFPQRPW